ncbi:hypothetical protein HAX54_045725, partial [Datura stramonium]|nr:hypothetical protein [Datura stramonium]
LNWGENERRSTSESLVIPCEAPAETQGIIDVVPTNSTFSQSLDKCLRLIGASRVESIKDEFPDIYNQISIRYWGPFTIPVDPYFPELVWEFYASYRA